MVVIKRYPNRKLYDTEAKQYTSLDGIAEMIRMDKEIQVVDHVTGEDLTTLSLTQIIVEREKRRAGSLPNRFLRSFIQTFEQRISPLQENQSTNLLYMDLIDDEIDERIQFLVRTGRLSEAEARNWTAKLLEDYPGFIEEYELDQQIQAYLTSHQAPRQDDLDRLILQIEELAESLAELFESGIQSNSIKGDTTHEN